MRCRSLAVVGSLLSATPVLAQTTAPITAADLRTRLFLIADDSMAGRATGSRGGQLTTDYIAAEFRRLGLVPAGDDGGYFQTIPFFRLRADRNQTLSVGGTPLGLGTDLVPIASAAVAPARTAERAIYGGALTDSSTWIPADAAQGAVVVVSASRSSGRGIAGFVGSVRQAARWAAAAALVLPVQEQFGREQIMAALAGRVVTDTTRRGTAPLIVVASQAAAERLLGRPLGEARPGTQGPPLSGSLGVGFFPLEFPARNVVAILPGSDPSRAKTYVSVTAHSDHVGFDHLPVDHDSLRAFNRVVRPMGADSPPRQPTAAEAVEIRRILDSLRAIRPARRDSIRNGADDDGSGTVALLEVAERLAQGPRPKRSVLFVAHTAEEEGLVGSAWFTDHPTVPTDSIIGEIDMDMVGRGSASDLPNGGPGYLEAIGLRRLSRAFGDLLDRVNARQPRPFGFNLEYDRPGHPLQYYCRADHYSYARYGIPSVAFSRGEHLDYHQVTDEPQYIDYDALERVARFVGDATVELANQSARPALDHPTGNPRAPCVQ